jgi:Rieske Fe-S protein
MSGRSGPDRRQLLRLAGGTVAVVAATAVGCGDPTATELSGPVAAGNVSDLSAGTWRAVGDSAVVGRDAQGLFAMSTVCTHARCPAGLVSRQVSDGLYCGCHGSRFDGQGAVTQGPAARPLAHYRVDLAADGGLTVRGDVRVAATDRTAVPG